MTQDVRAYALKQIKKKQTSVNTSGSMRLSQSWLLQFGSSPHQQALSGHFGSTLEWESEPLLPA